MIIIWTFRGADRVNMKLEAKSDIEIAQNAQIKPITEVAVQIGLEHDDLELYGKYKAKLSFEALKKLKTKNSDHSRFLEVRKLVLY